MDFVWHGGEPLLHEEEYYKEIFQLQRKYLNKANIPFTNSIQTNLYILNDEKIEFLKHNFDNIGVSIDLFGDLRVTAGHKPSQQVVLKNMQRLIDANIRFGCICVLSKPTTSKILNIFQFFAELNIAFRILPIYRTGFENQHNGFGIDVNDIITSFKKLIDAWFDMEGDLQIRPVQDYITNVLKKYGGQHLCQDYYFQNGEEVLFIVDTNGGVFSNADAYNPDLCYGNIFTSGFDELFSSAAYTKTINNRRNRIDATCKNCSFYGACSGFFMGEATPEQRVVDESGNLTCSIAFPIHQYIEEKLTTKGIIDPKQHNLNFTMLPPMDFSLANSEAIEFM